MAKPDQKQLQEVMANYQRVLSGYFSKEFQEVQIQQEERKKEIVQMAYPMVAAALVGTVVINKDIMVNQQKLKLMQQLGPDLYQMIYNFMVAQRSNSSTNEQAMYDELKRMVGGDKKQLGLCFQLDGIIFQEILQAERLRK